MSLALARKFRPKNFAELVGQKHISQALIYALEKKEIHHAYLFTGTRGVGKTTIARIFAKSLNCEKGISSEPCGECENCREIDAGTFPDLIEIDAASRSQVESTRQFLNNVPYKPVKGRFKVYLIDEVHMFSDGSFNALLKTLEEPPEHIKFILATTDPQKIPQTVISRCLQFQLKNMTESQIKEHLTKVLREEGVNFEGEALSFIAEAAQGSMRDALSILDQAKSYGRGEVRSEDCASLLGAVPFLKIKAIFIALLNNDAKSLRVELQGLEEYSPDYSDLLKKIIKTLQQITIAQLKAQRFAGEIPEDLVKIAEQIPAELVQIWYEIAQDAWQSIAFQPDSALAMEMTLLRMLVFRPKFLSLDNLKIVSQESIKKEEPENKLAEQIISEAKEEKAQIIAEAKNELEKEPNQEENLEDLNSDFEAPPWENEIPPDFYDEKIEIQEKEKNFEEEEEEEEEEEKKKLNPQEVLDNLELFIKQVIENKDLIFWHDLISALPSSEKKDLKELLANNFFPLKFNDNSLTLGCDEFGEISYQRKDKEFSDFFAFFLRRKIKIKLERKKDFQSYDEFFKQKKEQEKIDLLAKVKKNPKHKLLETVGISLNEVKIKNS